VLQNAAPAAEYEPETEHATQPEIVEAPFVEEVPAGQLRHAFGVCVVFQYVPGGQEEQLGDPTVLWPLPHGVQESTAPAEYVFIGQVVNPVREGSFAVVPDKTVEQYVAPASEYVPIALQARQPPIVVAPLVA
jgi:hypothetical protein